MKMSESNIAAAAAEGAAKVNQCTTVHGDDEPSTAAHAQLLATRPPLLSEKLNFGVLCAEHTLKKLELAIQALANVVESSSASACGGVSAGVVHHVLKSVPSWKYPHLPLSTISTGHIIQITKELKLRDQAAYLQLIELLTDRLYYVLVLSFVQLCSISESLVEIQANNVNAPGAKSVILAPQVDDEDLNSIGQLDLVQIVRQIGGKLHAIENRINTIKYGHLTHLSSKKNGSSNVSVSVSNVSPHLQQFKNFGSQTAVTSLDCCESCFLVCSQLKVIREKIRTCLDLAAAAQSDKDKEHYHGDGDDYLWATQLSAVSHWSHSVGEDCDQIYSHITRIHKQNDTLRNTLIKLKAAFDKVEKQLAKSNGMNLELGQRNNELSGELEAEKVRNQELECKSDSMEIRCKKLEDQITSLQEDSEIERKERGRLESDLEKLNSTHDQLERKHDDQEECLAKLKNLQENDKKENELLREEISQQHVTISAQTKELHEQSGTLSQIRSIEDDNKKLRAKLHKMKEEQSKLRETSNNKLKRIEEQTLEIETISHKYEEETSKVQALSKKYEEIQSQIDLLVLYPQHYNGEDDDDEPRASSGTPAGTGRRRGSSILLETLQDEPSDSDPLTTMQNQVAANEIRIEWLIKQNEKLTSALQRVRRPL